MGPRLSPEESPLKFSPDDDMAYRAAIFALDGEPPQRFSFGRIEGLIHHLEQDGKTATFDRDTGKWSVVDSDATIAQQECSTTLAALERHFRCQISGVGSIPCPMGVVRGRRRENRVCVYAISWNSLGYLGETTQGRFG